MSRWRPDPRSRTRKKLREIRRFKEEEVPEGMRFPTKKERDEIDLARREKKFEEEGVIAPSRRVLRNRAKGAKNTGSGYTKPSLKKRKEKRRKKGG